MPLEAALQTLRDTCAAMPPLAALGVAVDGYADGRFGVRAPLALNVNDKGNAFGGSLTSLMTLAGWGLVNLQLQLSGLEAEVYVADSDIRYRAPVYDDLRAEAWLADGQSWEDFLATLRQRGRARVRIEAGVPLAEGGMAAELGGRFVAIAKG
ncbi:thioesterase [Pseudoxanthomonas kalamensis DSM 18571]|uniref:YiiD C-terminal domain-containing protein n=1 Tax=Pseudoxanthomonas kalamensis TaxID=289483 RepID=UPI0013919C74|nr:YiiD C-terminal domain-containing protein [Pseudoxanthomonas kalamensis]KAF1712199.1 thioesterase [Pseudoxanthomonas kalamensis DSM 18571]